MAGSSWYKQWRVGMWLMWYAAGLLTIPVFLLGGYLGRALTWSCIDTYHLFRDAELREGRSKLHWLWILPKALWLVFWRTLWNDLKGARRVG